MESPVWAFLGGSVDAGILLLKIFRFGGIAGQLQFCQGIQSDVTWEVSSVSRGGLCLYAKLVYVALYNFCVVVACC